MARRDCFTTRRRRAIPSGMKHSDQAKGLLLTTLGALAIVPDSLFIRLIAADALVISFWRSVLVGLAITLWIAFREGAAPFRAVLATGWRGWSYMIAIGISGVLFVLAVSLTSVANVVFIIASMPVFAAVFSWLLLGEPITRRMGLTMAAVLPGLGIIAYGSGETEGASLTGDLLALAVSAAYALGLTLVRQVKSVSMVPAVGISYLGVAALLAIWLAGDLALTVPQLGLSVAHAAFITASAVFMAIGPRFIPSAEVALLLLLESVLAPLLVWAVMGENPGPWTLTGGAVVLGALALSNWVALRRAT
jgi:drug/metabolite transporter (DMT)-like permease